VLTQKGTLVPASNTRNRWIGGFSRVLPARLMAPFVSQRIRAPEMAPNQADPVALAALMESGKLSPVIDRTYPLAEVPEARRYFEEDTPEGRSSSPCEARLAVTHPRETPSPRLIAGHQPTGPLGVGLLGQTSTSAP
jgi:hypothetical protein